MAAARTIIITVIVVMAHRAFIFIAGWGDEGGEESANAIVHVVGSSSWLCAVVSYTQNKNKKSEILSDMTQFCIA